MSIAGTVVPRNTQILNRVYARLSVRRRAATGFVSQPEPRTVGSFAKGRQMIGGNLLFAGTLVEAPERSLWSFDAPDQAYEADRQGFGWLDDLAAVGDLQARRKAQEWLFDWIGAYGRGIGPGWAPELTGRRIIRCISHGAFLLRGLESEQKRRFHQSLARQTWFLTRRWQGALPGLPRFEALTGLIFAGVSVEGMAAMTGPAIRAMAQECDDRIDNQGGLPTRNPAELLEIFMLLTWSATAMQEAGRAPPQAHSAAMERIAPTLRTLRHADGGLARFHGGGRGLEGRLDHALAASRVRARPANGLAMGFARLSAGRTSIVVDASAPPEGRASCNAHASTLAFELTSGRRPLIVNCGSGAGFGADWRRRGRATPSHSVLCLDGFSSACLTEPEAATGREALVDGPDHVPIEITETPDAIRFQGGHNGYAVSHGVTVARRLELTFDGRGLAGEDMLLAMEDADKRRFDQAMDAARLAGLKFDIRFHLHPDVDAALNLGGAAVSLTLKSGEIWMFRHDGTHNLSLQASVFLEKGRLKPRTTKQIVLMGRAMEYATRVRWSLSRAGDTAIAVRDLNRDESEIVNTDMEDPYT